MSGIVILGGVGDATHAVYHALADLGVVRVIVERPVPRGEFLKKRVRRLGLRKVVGQVAFAALVVPPLTRRSRARVQEIDRAWNIRRTPPPADVVTHVGSVNDEETARLLDELRPAVVVVQGTRIIARRLLERLPCPVINMHAGITPLYRGVHGGYWALTRADRAHCGVTVHSVDAGIDTGGILGQAQIAPRPDDDFSTYPALQLGAGLPVLHRVVDAALRGTVEPRPAPPGPSRLWSHPTIFEYAWHRLRGAAR